MKLLCHEYLEIRSEQVSKNLSTLISQLQKYKEQGWESWVPEEDIYYTLSKWRLETDEEYSDRTGDKDSRYKRYLQLKKEFEPDEIPHC